MVSVLVSAGTPPNLIVFRPNDAAQLYDIGASVNFETELKSLPAWSKVRPQIPPSFLEALTWRQALVGLPYQIAQQAIAIATNHLDKAGLRPPNASWTWNDFLEIAKRAARPPDVWGMDITWRASGWTLWAGSNGARFLNKELSQAAALAMGFVMPAPALAPPTPLTVDPGLSAVEFNGSRVEYCELGRGPALVILHGGRCSADDWSNVAPTLAQRYRVVIPDGLVHPLDPWRIWGLLDFLGIDRTALLAHSAGGMCLRAMYRLQPHRVRAVIGIDTQGVGQTIVARELPNERFSPAAAALYERHRAAMEELRPAHRGDYPSAVTLERRLLTYRRAEMTPEEPAQTRPAPRHIHRVAALPPPPEPIADSGKFIVCPVLVVHTGRGKLGSEDVSREWIEQHIQARDVEYVVVRNAGHWPWLEDPEWFLSHVEPFLARTSAGSACRPVYAKNEQTPRNERNG
ncbi:MAG: alpha/beta fold hydrolase [Chloroflexi bacterium]|nr:alpha/beta fold hydrolase [Chloroflexota bacterium]